MSITNTSAQTTSIPHQQVLTSAARRATTMSTPGAPDVISPTLESQDDELEVTRSIVRNLTDEERASSLSYQGAGFVLELRRVALQLRLSPEADMEATLVNLYRAYTNACEDNTDEDSFAADLLFAYSNAGDAVPDSFRKWLTRPSSPPPARRSKKTDDNVNEEVLSAAAVSSSAASSAAVAAGRPAAQGGACCEPSLPTTTTTTTTKEFMRYAYGFYMLINENILTGARQVGAFRDEQAALRVARRILALGQALLIKDVLDDEELRVAAATPIDLSGNTAQAAGAQNLLHTSSTSAPALGADYTSFAKVQADLLELHGPLHIDYAIDFAQNLKAEKLIFDEEKHL